MPWYQRGNYSITLNQNHGSITHGPKMPGLNCRVRMALWGPSVNASAVGSSYIHSIAYCVLWLAVPAIALADIVCLAWGTMKTARCHDDICVVSGGTVGCRLKNNCKHCSLPSVCQTQVMALWHEHTFGITDHLYGDALVYRLPSQKCLVMQSLGGFFVCYLLNK